MKQVIVFKLAPTKEQAASLLRTMERFNAACDAIAAVAFHEKMVSKFRLQKIVYRDIRETFNLSAQMTIRAIAKTAEAYKRDKTVQPSFRPHGAMTYDERILAWKGVDTVSLLSLDGRLVVPMRYGAYQAARMDRIKGQADLVYRDGVFYLYATVDVPEPPEEDPEGWLGVDMGIVSLAVDSDGNTYSGSRLSNMRRRHERLRQRLQGKGTKSAKRLLRKRKSRQARFQRNTNHILSKSIVRHAQDTRQGIAIEELGGIRDRVTVRRKERSKHGNWGFLQLRSFIEYKAHMAGVAVVAINPRDTSRTCPCCGCVSKKNRPNQSTFSCVSCGFAQSADHNAAVVIGRRAAFNQPYAEGDFCPLSAIPRL